MIDSLIETIIKEKKTCYFISPHFDDAVFSAGSLISYLSTKTKVAVVNVFTKSGEKPYTLSAKVYLKQCSYSDANELFINRETEDALVLNRLGGKVINLGFVDALWRRKPPAGILSQTFRNIAELQVIYPTYRFHILKGKVAKQDDETIVQIQKKLSETIDPATSVIFCPFGIGNHIDHVITRIACEKQFPQVIYWSDFPYNLHTKVDIHSFDTFQFDRNLNEKKELIQGYVSQYDAMFRQGLQLQPDIFYLSKGIKV